MTQASYSSRHVPRSRRRPHRRRRPLRHRRRLPPADPTARRRPTRSSRRATPSAAPGTSSAIRASARTPTCTRSATASSRGRTRRRSPTARRSCDYIRETARENGDRRADPLRPPRGARRVVLDERALDGRPPSAATPASTVTITAGFLFMCTGYYRYDEGYTPEFAGRRALRAATVVHPQHWPEDLDYAGKRVVVIGSGATAVTLVPAMAEQAAHVTMLQRSPTYIISLPGEDPIANGPAPRAAAEGGLRGLRWKNVAGRRPPSSSSAAARPRLVKRAAAPAASSASCPPATTSTPHFTPRYNPWDQRLCLVPDGDLFEALARRQRLGRDRRDRDVHRAGLRLAVRRGARGRHRRHRDRPEPAGARRHRARRRRRARSSSPTTVGYKGMMLSGVPNMALAIGYTNASWTLKCDLTCEYVCRLLNHMDAHGYAPGDAASCATRRRRRSRSSTSSPATCSASLDQFPKQGVKAPVAAAPELRPRHPRRCATARSRTARWSSPTRLRHQPAGRPSRSPPSSARRWAGAARRPGSCGRPRAAGSAHSLSSCRRAIAQRRSRSSPSAIVARIGTRAPRSVTSTSGFAWTLWNQAGCLIAPAFDAIRTRGRHRLGRQQRHGALDAALRAARRAAARPAGRARSRGGPRVSGSKRRSIAGKTEMKSLPPSRVCANACRAFSTARLLRLRLVVEHWPTLLAAWTALEGSQGAQSLDVRSKPRLALCTHAAADREPSAGRNHDEANDSHTG